MRRTDFVEQGELGIAAIHDLEPIGFERFLHHRTFIIFTVTIV